MISRPTRARSRSTTLSPASPSGGGQFTSTAFPGNIIPANRISPVAKAVLDYYSLPKNPGLAGNIFDSTLLEKAAYDTTTVRLDQKVSNNNRMFVRGSYYKRDSHYNDYMGNGLTSTNFQFISYQAMVDDVHVFNPTTVLNVRYGYNRFERNSGQEAEYVSNFDLTDIGMPAAYNNFVPADAATVSPHRVPATRSARRLVTTSVRPRRTRSMPPSTRRSPPTR